MGSYLPPAPIKFLEKVFIMRFGRIYEGEVVSVTETPQGRTIEEHVGALQAVDYTAIPDHVGIGFVQQLDETWLTPEEAQAKKQKRKQP